MIATVPIDFSNANRFIGIDVTDLVKAWVSGAAANNGLALVPVEVSGIAIELDSKDNQGTSHEAKLEISTDTGSGPCRRNRSDGRQVTPV